MTKSGRPRRRKPAGPLPPTAAVCVKAPALKYQVEGCHDCLRRGIFLKTTARPGRQQPVTALREKLISRLIQQNAGASLKSNEIRPFGKMEEKIQCRSKMTRAESCLQKNWQCFNRRVNYAKYRLTMKLINNASKAILRPFREVAGRFVLLPRVDEEHFKATIIYKAAQIITAELVQGDYLEFGVFRGGSFASAFQTLKRVHEENSADAGHYRSADYCRKSARGLGWDALFCV